jgi:hypothetical protein
VSLWFLPSGTPCSCSLNVLSKRGARRPARGGLNFSRNTHFLRCLTVTDTKPHPACKANLSAINVNYPCSEKGEELGPPEDLRIQSSLVAFAVKHSLSHRVVVIDWRDQLRPSTVSFVRVLTDSAELPSLSLDSTEQGIIPRHAFYFKRFSCGLGVSD